jgi:exodeoxyribonuclease V gamma subunit
LEKIQKLPGSASRARSKWIPLFPAKADNPNRSRTMNAPSIFPHATLDGLLDALLEDLREVQEGSTGAAALKPVPVVVPSIQFTDWLQISIARRRGLCMGFEFLMPQRFVERALALADGAEERRENPWSQRNLAWLILPHIAEYEGRLGVTDASPRDRLALANLLADQFDQYAHFRPQIVAAWSEGKSAAGEGCHSGEWRARGWTERDRENEGWQRELWMKVQSAIGGEGQARRHPSLLPEQLWKDADFLASLREAFPRLLVVGTGAFDPLLVRVLKLLEAAGSEVRAHIALPSLGYLGGLRKSPPRDDQDPESIEMRDGHPLLVSMGRHAVGSFLLLGELDENYTHWPEAGESDEDKAPATLLGQIQADIRGLKAPARSFNHDGGDISLRVHSCFGPRREMEVLRDELLRAFDDLKDLKPEEVIVVTPSLETYAPLVPAILDQTPALPVRLTELPPSEQDPMAEGLLALLDMARSRCEASGLLELLHLRAVRACLGIPDDPNAIERLREWICASGLTCGLDEEAECCRITIGSWRFARDRLIAGAWFGDEARAQYPDGDYVLPVADDLGGNFDLKAAFIQWLWTLARTLREWSAEATPAVWSERLSGACDQLLSSGDEDSMIEIQYALNLLSQVPCQELLDAAAISDWLQAASAETARRTAVSGRITFGRFKQLQNIPCRVLAMVGMQDGAFPRQNRLPAWDLLHCDPRAWDRNARIDDRQLFLDAILTPTDRLIITASTRNVRSGRTEPLSSCVDELLRVAGATSRTETNLVVEHRLQPFAPGYFGAGDEDPALPRSFDAGSARVARSLLRTATADRKGLPFWNAGAPVKAPAAEALELTIDQLVNFWKDPARAFIRAQGIALPFEEEDDHTLDRSPLALDGLEEWSVRSAILRESCEAESSMTYVKARLAADRGLPASELGNCKWEALYNITEPLDRKLKTIKTGELTLDLAVTGITPPVRVTGALVRGKIDGAEVLLAWRPGTFKSAKHYLQPWIEAIAAACAGAPLPTCLLDDENLDVPARLATFEPARAAELLERLVAGYVEGQSRPLCYAPATSDAYAKACQHWGAQADQNAIDAASDKWNEEPFSGPKGEGFSEFAQVAWRDQDPFAYAPEWHRWAAAIANPLRTWSK